MRLIACRKSKEHIRWKDQNHAFSCCSLDCMFIIDTYKLFTFVLAIVHERIAKSFTWWWMNDKFIVKDNYSIQKLLDIFFS
jgi:hypothetical protein